MDAIPFKQSKDPRRMNRDEGRHHKMKEDVLVWVKRQIRICHPKKPSYTAKVQPPAEAASSSPQKKAF